VVWLAGGLVAWGILRWFVQAGIELFALVHAFAASMLMAAWRQSPAARDPEWRAMGEGAAAAVLVIWCNVAVVSLYILARPESFQPGRLTGPMAWLAPLFLGSVIALIVGAVGGCFGALLAYNLRRGRRRGEQTGAP
jgi:hypothetical protein